MILFLKNEAEIGLKLGKRGNMIISGSFSITFEARSI